MHLTKCCESKPSISGINYYHKLFFGVGGDFVSISPSREIGTYTEGTILTAIETILISRHSNNN